MNNFFGGEENRRSLLERREFVSTALKAMGITSLMTIPGMRISAAWVNSHTEYTVQEIIDLILKTFIGKHNANALADGGKSSE